ncbi:ABC transporter permease [Pokkaliibacter plantistimulans]|uniref:ABC transporter permease n=2 Tax=Pseudomonadota TaxID=1224 RepID=A0A2S5KHE7_9PROT|nr:ABC transporter permease [Pokkaliibacter plantistimulans]
MQNKHLRFLPAARHWQGLLLPVGILALCQGISFLSPGDSQTLAAPHAIISALSKAVTDGTLLQATVATLAATLIGLGLGALLGTISGMLLGLSSVLQHLCHFSIEVLRPVPPIALIPIFMLAMGFGYPMEVATVAFAAFWPMLIMTLAAVRNIERNLLEVAQVLQLSPAARISKIMLPAAAPRIFVAFRLAAGIALMVAVTTEITINPQGLGYHIMQAQQSMRPDLMLALLIWIGALGWSINTLLVSTQRRLFPAFNGRP